MFGRIVEVTRINIESQDDDTIATVVMTRQRVAICTRIFEETRCVALRQTETHRVSFADRSIDDRRILHMIVYIQMIDAIQRDTCDQRVFISGIHILCRCGEELLIICIPDMRKRSLNRRTNSDGITEDMRLMNREVQHDRTVATVYTRHGENVFTCLAEHECGVFCAA